MSIRPHCVGVVRIKDNTLPPDSIFVMKPEIVFKIDMSLLDPRGVYLVSLGSPRYQ